jgi:hypothetical protein
MSTESPGDLVVAFRSFGRRLTEATGAAAADPTVVDLTHRLSELMNTAAHEMGVGPASEVAATGSAVANAIAAIPADAWDGDRLDHLRQIALDAGRILRQIDDAANAAEG